MPKNNDVEKPGSIQSRNRSSAPPGPLSREPKIEQIQGASSAQEKNPGKGADAERRNLAASEEEKPKASGEALSKPQNAPPRSTHEDAKALASKTIKEAQEKAKARRLSASLPPASQTLPITPVSIALDSSMDASEVQAKISQSVLEALNESRRMQGRPEMSKEELQRKMEEWAANGEKERRRNEDGARIYPILKDPAQRAKLELALRHCISKKQFRFVIEFHKHYSPAGGVEYSSWFYPFIKRELSLLLDGNPAGQIELAEALGVRPENAIVELLGRAFYRGDIAEIRRLEKRFQPSYYEEKLARIRATGLSDDNEGEHAGRKLAKDLGVLSDYDDAKLFEPPEPESLYDAWVDGKNVLEVFLDNFVVKKK